MSKTPKNQQSDQSQPGSSSAPQGEGAEAAPSAPTPAAAPAAQAEKKAKQVRVRCDIAGDDTEINGVGFEVVKPKQSGKAPYRVSAEVDREVAERFARIPGYSIIE